MSLASLGAGDGEYGAQLGFTGNSCVDFLRAFNLRRTANGVIGYACDQDLLVAGSSVVIQRVNSDGSAAPTYTAVIRSVDAYQSIQGSPAYYSLLSMTPNDALVYSSAIAVVWAVAWGIKVVIKTLNTERNEDD